MATGGSGKERNLIRQYVKEYGYNILEGGNNPSMPKEIREYMSKVMMGIKKLLQITGTQLRERSGIYEGHVSLKCRNVYWDSCEKN